MNKKQLLENIEIIFNKNGNELENGNLNYRFKNSKDRKSIMNEHLKVPYLNVSRSEISVPLFVDNPEDYILDYPIMDTLKKLYITIQHEKDLVENFHRRLDDFIKKKLTRETRERSYSQEINRRYKIKITREEESILPFSFFVYTGQLDKSLKYINKRIFVHLPLIVITQFINDLLRYNYHILNGDYLKEIRTIYVSKNAEFLAQDDSIVNQIVKQIDEIEYNKLLKSWEGINFEINQDKDKVIQKIRDYGFNQEINKRLNDIDKYLYSNNDEIVKIGVITILRNILGDIVIGISKQIEKITGDPIPKKDINNPDKKEMGLARDYLRKHLKLTQQDNLLITGLAGIITKKGPHTLVSKKEYFRLTRNITLEIIYFLLLKLDEIRQENR